MYFTREHGIRNVKESDANDVVRFSTAAACTTLKGHQLCNRSLNESNLSVNFDPRQLFKVNNSKVKFELRICD